MLAIEVVTKVFHCLNLKVLTVVRYEENNLCYLNLRVILLNELGLHETVSFLFVKD